MRLRRPPAIMLLVLLAALVAAGPASGTIRNWSGASVGEGNFESPDSWFNSVPNNDTTSDVASFHGFDGGPDVAAVDFTTSRSVSGLVIGPPADGATAPAFTFSGSQVTLGNAGFVVDPDSATGHRVENNVLLGSSQTWNIGGQLTVVGSVSGSGRLTKIGGGTLRVEGTGNWTGGTQIQSGTLQTSGGAALADNGQVFFPSASTGTLELEADEQLGGLDSASNAASAVLLGGHSLTIGGFAGTSNFRNGSITGTGQLIKVANTVQIISIATEYSGGTTVSAGELRIANATGSALGSGTVTINGSGRLSGSGSTSGAVVAEGDGRVSPGVTTQTGDTLRVGALDLTAATTGGLELNIDAGGVSNDFVEVAGTAALGGTFSLLATTPFTPALGDSWEILAATGVAGQFDVIDGPGLPAHLGWRTRFDDSTLSITVVMPGDYNGDLVVDAADYTAWRDTLGQTGGNLPADGNGDFFVNQADYELWNQNFGLTLFDFGSAAEADYNGNGVVDAADYTVWRDTLGQIGPELAADGFGPTGVPDGVVDQFDYRFWKARFGELAESGSSGAGSTSAHLPVPEPNSLALASLGVVTLFVTCRELLLVRSRYAECCPAALSTRRRWETRQQRADLARSLPSPVRRCGCGCSRPTAARRSCRRRSRRSARCGHP